MFFGIFVESALDAGGVCFCGLYDGIFCPGGFFGVVVFICLNLSVDRFLGQDAVLELSDIKSVGDCGWDRFVFTESTNRIFIERCSGIGVMRGTGEERKNVVPDNNDKCIDIEMTKAKMYKKTCLFIIFLAIRSFLRQIITKKHGFCQKITILLKTIRLTYSVSINKI